MSQDQRLTAAEIHPEGFDQPDFLATLGDLRALATFQFEGRSLAPQQVSEVQWGRDSQNPRNVRLNFSADYVAPKSAQNLPELDLRREAVREVLTEAFQAHLRALLGSSVLSSSTLSVSSPLCPGHGLKTGSIPFRFRIGLEGDPASMLTSFRRARSQGPALKPKDCPLM